MENKDYLQQKQKHLYCTGDTMLSNVYIVEPVKSDTTRDQGNVSDCTGCWNTQVLF
jgi:hypothetical protein